MSPLWMIWLARPQNGSIENRSEIRAANVSLPSPQRGEGRKVAAAPRFQNLTHPHHVLKSKSPTCCKQL